MASILLAFAIDAWWDNRKEDARRLDYLAALEGEFAAAREEMLEQIDDHRRQVATMEALLRGLADGAPPDELQPHLGRLSGLFVYGPAHPVFEDIANAGAINVLESAKLRFALLRYGQAKDFLADLAEREAALWHGTMHPYLIEHIDMLPASRGIEDVGMSPRFESGLDSLYDDRTFQNLLLRRRGSIRSQMRIDDQVLEAIDDVLAEVRAAQ